MVSRMGCEPLGGSIDGSSEGSSGGRFRKKVESAHSRKQEGSENDHR